MLSWIRLVGGIKNEDCGGKNMTDCWKCKNFKSCKGRSFGCVTEHLCLKPHTAISLSTDMIELLESVGCNSFENKS